MHLDLQCMDFPASVSFMLWIRSPFQLLDHCPSNYGCKNTGIRADNQQFANAYILSNTVTGAQLNIFNASQ